MGEEQEEPVGRAEHFALYYKLDDHLRAVDSGDDTVENSADDVVNTAGLAAVESTAELAAEKMAADADTGQSPACPHSHPQT